MTHDDFPLLLVFGLPRSGTTWLGKIFDSHPRVLYRHEPDNFPRLEALPRFPSPNSVNRYDACIQRFVSELVWRDEASVAAKTPLFRKRWESAARHRLVQGSAAVAKVADKCGARAPVLFVRGEGIRPSPPVVWKSIESLGRFGMLLKALPNARAIHLVRHPCGQINSVLRGERAGAFDDNSPVSEFYELFRELIDSDAGRRSGLDIKDFRAMRPVERLAWRWALTNEKALDESRGSSRARTVLYEDLCADPRGMARELFDFAGLEWNRQTEQFVQHSTHSNGRAYYSVYKRPEQAVARWREELSERSSSAILGVLRRSAFAKMYGEEPVTITAKQTITGI
jgi:hypothetical protein